MSEQETPRTDEAEFFVAGSDRNDPDEGYQCVEASFSRALECELQAMTAERDAWRKKHAESVSDWQDMVEMRDEARKALGECLERFRRYAIDIDGEPTYDHLKFVQRIKNITDGRP